MSKKLLINQSVSAYTKDDKIIEGIVLRRKDGRKVVANSNKQWCFLEDLKKIKKTGRMIENSIADSFATVFKPIDFEHKVKSDKDQNDAIDAAISIVKSQNKDASSQTDEDLKNIATDTFNSLKSKSEVKAGNTTDTKEDEKKIEELSYENEEDRDEAIADNTLTENVFTSKELIEYFNDKRKKIASLMESTEKEAIEEMSYFDRDYGMTPENLEKAKDFISTELEEPFNEITKKVAEDFECSPDEAENLVVDTLSDTSYNDSTSYVDDIDNEIEGIIDDFYSDENNEYGSMENLFGYVAERMELPDNLIKSLLKECNGDHSEAICRISEVLSKN